MQESAWVQLRQAAHHWTTVVTLLDGDPVGVIPLGGTLQDAFNDARFLKNDRRKVGQLFEKGKPFLCHSRLRLLHRIRLTLLSRVRLSSERGAILIDQSLTKYW